MSPLETMVFVTICTLFTILFTTPGAAIIGFKLHMSFMLAPIGVVMLIFASPGFNESIGVEVIQHRVNMTLIIWLTISWLVLLAPYSTNVRARRKAIAKQMRQVAPKRKR